MSEEIPFELTQYGFTYGAADVKRICSDDKKGWVVIGIETPRQNIQIYVTKTGKIRVHDVKDHVEWIRKEKDDIKYSENQHNTEQHELKGQTGITTRQIFYAPQEAIFVWVNDNLKYPKEIAEKYDRNDLEIVSVSWLFEDKWKLTKRRKVPSIIFDHSISLDIKRKYINLCL